MLLQLAIDSPDHLGIIAEVIEFVDIVEVGTPLLKRFGVAAIQTVQERAAGRPVLVDTKTVDGGATEAAMVFETGAAMMTVLSNASPATWAAVNDAARHHGGTVVIDTIADPHPPARPGLYPDQFTHVALHSGTDMRLAGDGTSDHIAAVGAVRALGYRVSLAGGINEANFATAIEAAPEIVVVGRAITYAKNPRSTAAWMSSQLAERVSTPVSPASSPR